MREAGAEVRVLSATYPVGTRGFVRWELGVCSRFPGQGQEAEYPPAPFLSWLRAASREGNLPALSTCPTSKLCAHAPGEPKAGPQGSWASSPVWRGCPTGPCRAPGPPLGSVAYCVSVVSEPDCLALSPSSTPTLLRAIDELLDISELLILPLSDGDSALLTSQAA